MTESDAKKRSDHIKVPVPRALPSETPGLVAVVVIATSFAPPSMRWIVSEAHPIPVSVSAWLGMRVGLVVVAASF